jgi:hypothetical protein
MSKITNKKLMKSFCGCYTGPGGRFSRKEPPWQKKIKKALKIFFRRVILISLRFFKGQIK